MTEFAVVIPARYASERLPGKPFGILRANRCCSTSGSAQSEWREQVVIATDDQRIADAAEDFGARFA